MLWFCNRPTCPCPCRISFNSHPSCCCSLSPAYTHALHVNVILFRSRLFLKTVGFQTLTFDNKISPQPISFPCSSLSPSPHRLSLPSLSISCATAAPVCHTLSFQRTHTHTAAQMGSTASFQQMNS